MKLLLDTHAFAWALLDPDKVSRAARACLEADAASTVYVSLASVWEIAIKVGLGKWPDAAHLLENFEQEIAVADFALLLPAVKHVRLAGLMQNPHRDPFDRLLAAQAMIDDLTIVTADPQLKLLGARVLW